MLFELDVPALFEHIGDQTVARVRLVVLRKCPLGFVPCLLQLALERAAPVAALGAQPCERGDTRLEPVRRDELDDEFTQTLVNRRAAEAEAVRATAVKVAATQVARRGAALSPVANMQLGSRTARSAVARSTIRGRTAPRAPRRPS